MSVVFAIDNRTRSAIVEQVSVTLPDSWRLLSGVDEVRLAAGERRALILQVSVPSSAAAGRYAILLLRRTAARSIETDTAFVMVREVRSLALELISAPALARSGEPYTVDFLLHNRGNRPERAHATFSERPGFAIQSSWAEAAVGPGQSHPLSVTVTPSAGSTDQRPHHLSVIVAATDSASGRPVLTRASSSVLVLPVRSSGPDDHRLPAKVRLISSRAPGGVGNRGPSGMLEVSGGGPLRERGAARVDFLLRGPGAAGAAFNEWDEYRLKVTTPHLDLAVGDLTFRPAPILGHAREGTGVHAEARLGGFALTAMGYRDRRGYLDDQGYAASLEYGRHGIGSLALSAADRTGFAGGRAASLRARVTASQLASIDAEVARNLEPDSGAVAYRVQLGGVHRRFSYTLTQRHADADFAGFAPGLTSRSGRAELRLVGKLGIRAGVGQDRSAAQPSRLLFRSAQESRFVDAGTHFGQWFSAGIRMTDRHAVMGGETLVSAEDLVRLAGKLARGSVVLHAGLDVGQLATDGDSTRRPTRRESLKVGYTGRRNALSVAVEHWVGGRWYDRTSREQASIGVNALLRPVEWLTLRGGASISRDLVDPDRGFVNADVTLAVVPRRGHELSLRSRVMASGLLPGAEPTLRLAYSLPVGIPVPGGRHGGRLVGRVFDAESGRGLANATVVIGDRLGMTDGDGRFDISGVQEGAQYIQLDLGANEANRVPTVAMPLQVVSRNGGVTRIDVPVVRSISISGSVRRLNPRSMSAWDGSREALTDSVALPGVVIRLARSGQVITRMTDPHGRFSAGDLRPGRWTITLAPDGLPAHHYVEVPEIIIDVAPGQDASLGIDVLPRKRALVVVDRAEVIAEGAAIRPAPHGQPALPAADPSVRDQAPEWKTLQASPRRARAEENPITGAPRDAGIRSLLFLGQSFYIVGETDRDLQNIALLTYGDADMWPKLWHANRHQLSDPRTIPAGMVLVLPPRGPLTEAERRSRDALLHSKEAARP